MTVPSLRGQIVEAGLTWTGRSFEPGIRVEIGSDGRIRSAGRLEIQPTVLIRSIALLPGFVNAHSHSFQRGLRGRGEHYPSGAGTFWSWREAMYGLAARLDPDRLYAVTRKAYEEMLRAGITAVGEFHYLHHSTGDHAFDLDEAILSAAGDAGIRVVMLQAAYRTGGIGKPLAEAQRRFDTKDVARYWKSVDALGARLRRDQSTGAVAHSVRAVPIDEIAEMHRESRRRGIAFHMHVEEQRQEISDCVEAHGATPLALLNTRLEIDNRFTAVHCTHSEPADLARFLEAGGNVCITPLTEANLGDGIPDVTSLRAAGVMPSLGSDCNARISMLEEMRWLEYAQRLAHETRGAWADPSTGLVAPALLESATRSGARALSIEAGSIDAGAFADLVAIDLTSPVLDGLGAADLAEGLVFGASDEVVIGTAVSGEWRHVAPGSVLTTAS